MFVRCTTLLTVSLFPHRCLRSAEAQNSFPILFSHLDDMQFQLNAYTRYLHKNTHLRRIMYVICVWLEPWAVARGGCTSM